MQRRTSPSPCDTSSRREWRRFLLCLLLLLSVRSSIADWYDVPTGSMRPTIVEGDRVFVNKLAYGLRLPFTRVQLATWGTPERGDVVVCYSPVDGKRLVKRVLAVAGDRVAMTNNRLAINGAPVSLTQLGEQWTQWLSPVDSQHVQFFAESTAGETHPIMLNSKMPSPRSFAPVTVPENHVLLLGDNRNNSMDSRYFGFVHVDRVFGQANRVIMSINKDRCYMPRWGRLWEPLTCTE